MNNKKLYRSETDKMVGGVCSGLATYLGIDPTIMRLGFAIMGFIAPQTLLLYLILWVVIPPVPNARRPPMPPAPPTPPAEPPTPSI